MNVQALNPTVKIMSFILLAISVYQLTVQALCVLLSLLILLVFFCGHQGFIKLLKRAKWLLIAMIVIYALTTPGEYIKSCSLALAPTYEGLYHGFEQAIRLLIMLAGLAILNAITTREELIAGFYMILKPLKYFKLAPERFAARLWLTLYYVEHHAENSGANIQTTLLERMERLEVEPSIAEFEEINLKLAALNWRDALAIIVILILVYLLCV